MAIASLTLVACLFLPRLPLNVEILVTGSLIVFLGVPHGALDTLYLRKVIGIESKLKLVLMLAGYLTISAAIVLLWMVSPLLFLLGFLAASSFHFSGDPEVGASLATRMAVGIGVVTLPGIYHAEELRQLYSLLTNPSVASSVVSLSVPIAYCVCVVAAVALIIETFKKRYTHASELIIIVLLSTLAPPLLAFTVYFCLMHSARHILRTAKIVDTARGAFIFECCLPMVGVLLAGACAWKFRSASSLDAKVVQILFVTLAALTAPHMVIVEPVRFRGWSPVGTATRTREVHIPQS